MLFYFFVNNNSLYKNRSLIRAKGKIRNYLNTTNMLTKEFIALMKQLF